MGKISDMKKYFNNDSGNQQQAKKKITPYPVNKYTIDVDIQGLLFNDTTGSRIVYHEISDYLGSNFPARTLTISAHPAQLAKLLLLEKKDVNGFGQLYNLKLFVSPLSDEGMLNKAFDDGEFKALLINNESNFDTSSALDEESRVYEMNSLEPRTNITFYLFRDYELQFSTSNKTNFLYPNPTISDVFINSLMMSNPGLTCIISKFDHDPQLGNFLVRDMSFTDLIDVLEDEVGFYVTDYICFLEFKNLFFLNRSNDIKCQNKVLDNNLHIGVGRINETKTDRLITKMDETNFASTVGSQDIKIIKDSKSSIRKSYSYITPSGKKIDFTNSLSRNITTIRKITEAMPIQKTPNIQYEMIDVKIQDNSVNFLNPLTKIHYTDSNSVKRIFRMGKKEINVVSSQSSYIRLTGFRVL